MSAAIDVTTWLTDDGLENVWTGDAPADPDQIIVVYEYPGMESMWIRDTADNPAIERPRIQIMIRGTSYLEMDTRATNVHYRLLAANDVTIDGRYYGHIRHLQDGWLQTRDDRNRWIWTQNYQVQREALTPTV